jgi:hypothetical protein
VSTATDEPPLAVSSTALVDNLNADRVDGIEGTDLAAQIAILLTQNEALMRCATVWRYADLEDGTVLDCNTGVIWLKDASCAALGSNGDGTADWQGAKDAAAGLANGTCGLTDGSQAGEWRQPHLTELCSAPEPIINLGGECPPGSGELSLANVEVSSIPKVSDARGQSGWSEGDPFVGVQSATYWSGDDFVLDPADGWSVSLIDAVVATPAKSEAHYVWPVRELD